MKPTRLRFRLWNTREKIMYAPPFCKYLDITKEYHTLAPQSFINETIIMQSTGLLDINNKEIFEGDIIKYKQRFDTHGDIEQDVGEVYWDNEVAGFLIDQNYQYSFIYETMEHEIIGNIYEDPELLKGA